MKHQVFSFNSYAFDADNKTLTLEYGYDDQVTFTETFRFDFEYVNYDPAVLDRACQNLFFMAGVSYYKAYLASRIEVRAGQLDEAAASFFSKTYQRGLGEFFYVNHLDPNTPVVIPANGEQGQALGNAGTGVLVGLGGGKDSLVSVELLRDSSNVTTWSAGHHAQLQPLVERIALPHLWGERTWDRGLLEHNSQGAMNGHIPISAILACAGTVAAVLAGRRDIVVSNENSANEPTLTYQGQPINHQYSKSLEFEQDYQQLLEQQFGDTLRYYSLLRPLSELRISELFARSGFEKYAGVFSSCNRAFTHDSDHIFWCGECPKCAFVFLALTPFVAREKLEELFGKNLLLEPSLEPTYRQLLGIEGDKPLECVGEIKESRAAMRLAQESYPELSKYEFALPADYDYRTLAAHSIPQEIYQQVAAAFTA